MTPSIIDELARLEKRWKTDAEYSDSMAVREFRNLSLQAVAEVKELREALRPFAELVRIEPQPDSVYISQWSKGDNEVRREYRRGRGNFIETIQPPEGYELHPAPIKGIWFWQPREGKL